MPPRKSVQPVPLGETPLVDTPFKSVAIGLLLGPPKRNAYILTKVDSTTRYLEAMVLPASDNRHVADALFALFFQVGFPGELLSDWYQDTRKLMKEVLELLRVQHVTFTFHPACNGMVERFNGTLMSMLQKLADGELENLDQHLQAVLFAYCEVPQGCTGFASFELLHGRQVCGTLESLKQAWTNRDTDEEERTVPQ